MKSQKFPLLELAFFKNLTHLTYLPNVQNTVHSVDDVCCKDRNMHHLFIISLVIFLHISTMPFIIIMNANN